jgi:integrase/recombinase XerD
VLDPHYKAHRGDANLLRHCHASELLDEGFTIREVQEQLRHANIGTTEIYLHVRDADLRAKMQRRSSGSVRKPNSEEVRP